MSIQTAIHPNQMLIEVVMDGVCGLHPYISSFLCLFVSAAFLCAGVKEWGKVSKHVRDCVELLTLPQNLSCISYKLRQKKSFNHSCQSLRTCLWKSLFLNLCKNITQETKTVTALFVCVCFSFWASDWFAPSTLAAEHNPLCLTYCETLLKRKMQRLAHKGWHNLCKKWET